MNARRKQFAVVTIDRDYLIEKCGCNPERVDALTDKDMRKLAAGVSILLGMNSPGLFKEVVRYTSRDLSDQALSTEADNRRNDYQKEYDNL